MTATNPDPLYVNLSLSYVYASPAFKKNLFLLLLTDAHGSPSEQSPLLQQVNKPNFLDYRLFIR